MERFLEAGRVNRTIGRISFRPELVFGNELACNTARGPLFDTSRAQGQKMVDTALASDVLFLMARGSVDVGVIVSDDDDFLPVAFTAEAWNCDLFVLRSDGRGIENVSRAAAAGSLIRYRSHQ
jgi:hypothetical protein